MSKASASRLVRRLLSTEQGRQAVGNELGVEIAPGKPDAPQVERPRVAVLRPVYDKPEPEAQEALNQLAAYTRQFVDIFAPEGIRDASVVHWTRNHLISKLLRTKEHWTHVLFIDDDITAPTDGLLKMLAHKVDIVGALCTKRMFPPMPTAKEFDAKTGAIRPMLELTGEEGLIEVGAIGTGMILISKHALEQVAEAYLSCLYEQKYLGMSAERAEEIKALRLKFFDDFQDAFWFRFLPCVSGAAEYGEDIGFCIVAREVCGLKVYCDTTVQPGHIGRYAFSVRDFLPYQKHILAKASKMVGNPTVDVQFDDEESSSAEAEKHEDDMANPPQPPQPFNLTYEDEATA